METPEQLIEYFHAALGYMKEEGGHGILTEIAENAGIDRSTLGCYARGTRTPRPTVQRLIAEACGYDYVDFLELGKVCATPWDPPPIHSRYCMGFARGSGLTLKQAHIVILGLERTLEDKAYMLRYHNDFNMGTVDGADFKELDGI